MHPRMSVIEYRPACQIILGGIIVDILSGGFYQVCTSREPNMGSSTWTRTRNLAECGISPIGRHF